MPDIQQQLQEVTELISLPEVYLKVRRLMDNPASDIYDFAEVISVDPNLSTRVLKVVNSAYFGCPEPVEPFDPANPLMVFPGALTGSRSPYSGRTVVCAFSPQAYPHRKPALGLCDPVGQSSSAGDAHRTAGRLFLWRVFCHRRTWSFAFARALSY